MPQVSSTVTSCPLTAVPGQRREPIGALRAIFGQLPTLSFFVGTLAVRLPRQTGGLPLHDAPPSPTKMQSCVPALPHSGGIRSASARHPRREPLLPIPDILCRCIPVESHKPALAFRNRRTSLPACSRVRVEANSSNFPDQNA